jgi:sugar lactone lactonase YvrE
MTLAALVALTLIAGSAAARAQSCSAPPSYSPDFSSNACLALNGDASFQTGVLQVTPALTGQAGSVWYTGAQLVGSSFSSTFTFQLTDGSADGFAFLVQNSPARTSALGPGGCGMGFADDPQSGNNYFCGGATGGIPNSLAIGFKTYIGDGNEYPPGNSVFIASNGASPNCENVPGGEGAGTPGCVIAENTLTSPSISLANGSAHTATVTYTTQPSASQTNCSGSAGCLDVILDGTDLFPAGVPFNMTSIGLTSNSAYVGFTAATGADSENSSILSWTFSPQSFGDANVCPPEATTPAPCSNTFPVTFNFTAASTPVSQILALTQGAQGLDFSVPTSGPCIGEFTQGESCTVNATFSPTAPGLRLGAVELLGDTGQVLLTQFVYGIGYGPAVAFGPGIQTALVGINGVYAGREVALDGAGDLFIAENLNNQVVELPAGGGAQTTVGTGLHGPYGVAVDGAGDIFIADTGDNQVVEVPAGGGPQTTLASGLSSPYGVAVDGAGDLYIADTDNNRVLELPAGGGPQITVASGLNNPNTVVVDSAGDVFIVDSNSQLVKIPAGCVSSACQTGVGTGLNNPRGAAVDAAGDVFIADTYNSRVVEVPAGCTIAGCQTTVGTGFGYPWGVAVDGAGDIFITDTNDGEIAEVNRSKAPSLSFASTTVGGENGPQSVTIQNVGNQELTGSTALTASPNFAVDPSSTCGTIALVPGASCVESFDFEPQSIGNLVGTAVITDNALNGAPVTQTIILGGNGGYSLTISTAGSGSGTVSGSNCFSNTYPSGTTGNCTAVPAAGSTFIGWSGGTCSGSGSCLWSLNANTTIIASFTKFYPLTLTETGSGSGTVTSNSSASPAISCAISGGSVSGTCSENDASGGQVTLTANAYPGSAFTGWGDACSGTSAMCTVSVSAATSVSAGFAFSNVTVPNVVGLTQTPAATTAITASGLVLGTVTTQYSDTVASGSVISQNPNAETTALGGTLVNLVVSNGPPPASDQLTLENNYFVTGDYASAGVNLRGASVTNGMATGTITIPDLSTCSCGQGVPDGADIVAAYLYWEAIENTSSPSSTNATFLGYSITGQQIGSGVPMYDDGANTGTLRAYRANVNNYFPITPGPNAVRYASGTFTVSVPDGGTMQQIPEGASLVVIYRVLSPNFPLKSVVLYNGLVTPTAATGPIPQAVQGFYDAVGGANGTGEGELTAIYAGGETWNNTSGSAQITQSNQYIDTLNTGNAYAAVVLSTPVNNSDGDGILDAWKAGPPAPDPNSGTPGYYDVNTGLFVSLPGAKSGEQDLFVQFDYMCSAFVEGTNTCDFTQQNTYPSPDANGNDPLAMVTQAFLNSGIHGGVHLHLKPGNAILESTYTCTDPNPANGSLCEFPSTTAAPQPGVVPWNGGVELSKVWPANFNACTESPSLATCTPRFPFGQKDSYHYVLFGYSLAIPAWNSWFGSLTGITITSSQTNLVTTGLGSTCPSRVTISGVQGNPALNGVYNTLGCDPGLTTIYVPTPAGATLSWTYPNNTLPEPVIGITSGTVTSISGYSNVGGSDSVVSLGYWETNLSQDMSKSATVVAGTLFHELGHTLGLNHGGRYYDGASGSYVPTYEANCKPNYQSTMNYLFQLDGVGPNGAISYSNQTLTELFENSLAQVTQLYDTDAGFLNAPATFPTSSWYTPNAPSSTTSPATMHCDGSPLTGDTGYRVNGSITSSPGWMDEQNITFDEPNSYTQLRGYNDQVNLDLRQVGATSDEFASLANATSYSSGGVTFGGGGGVTFGGGGGATTELDYLTANSIVRPPPLATYTMMPGSPSIQVNWMAPAFGVVQTYTISRSVIVPPSTVPGPPVAIGSVSGVGGNAPATTFTDTNPPTNGTLIYTIATTLLPVPIDMTQRQSAPSPPAVLALNQTIVLDLPSSATLGASQPTIVTATAESNGTANGQLVSFSAPALGPCSVGSSSINAQGVSSATVTLNSTGSCTITASQAGDSNAVPPPTTAYSAATPVSGTFTISSQGSATKSQTITFGTLPSAQYGGLPFTVSAISNVGLPVSFSGPASGQPCSVSGTTVTITGAGLCKITAMAMGGPANGNTYSAASATESFNISTAPLTVTANPITIAYEQGIPTLTYTFGPLVNGDSYTAISGTPELSTTATVGSAVGAYPITVSTGTLAAANYSFLYVPGTLTIANGPFITVSPSSINFGPVNLDSITTKTVTVSNTGSATATISTPLISLLQAESLDEFVVVNLCPSSLAAGKSCTITVSFLAGTYYSTPQTATLKVMDNSPGSPQPVTLSATVLEPQTITFTSLPSSAVYNSGFTVAATGGGSGNPVTFTASGACSVPAGSATFTMTSGTGTCSVIANQAGNSTYAAAAQVTKTVTATLAPQTITLNNPPASAAYKSSFTATATASSGLGVTYTSSGACSNSGATYTMTSGTGTCSVIANQTGNLNYSAAPRVTKTTTATVAAQTITFTTSPPSSAAYKTSFTVAATASSGLAVTFTSSGACNNSGATYTMTSGTGTCSVIANQAGNSNYTAAPQVTRSVSATYSTATLTPASMNFGTVAKKSSSTQTATLTNTGTTPLIIASIGITGSGTFTETNTCPSSSSSLAAGKSCTISVKFTSGGATASASLTVTDNTAPPGTQSVTLSGN